MPGSSNVTVSKNVISITRPGASTDWGLHTLSSTAHLDRLEPGIPINRIVMTPGASRDIIVIKDNNKNGVEVCRLECASSYDQKVEYFYGQRIKPYIDVSACTHGQTSSSILKIVME